ncbi:hypothetical protein B0T24DRAFT_48481 [Lasiosphaeria ovina]|uniref:Uncharacterized protein n=1 Tax=Lasiosphaeria ovina TaxID=92902 RepID=A0AAE0NKU2_9PEZI|nr:hypothetical protein B0T24DRAFT_48481 [Lasiosphaeria ovina]
MKGIVRTAVAAVIAVATVAQAHGHGHRHRHVKHGVSGVEKRDGTVVVTEVVPAVETKYVLEGQEVDAEEAKKGIEDGFYLVMGTSTPSFSAPPPAVSTVSASTAKGAQFFEQKTSSSTSAEPTTSSAPPPPPPTTSSSAAATPSPAAPPAGIDVDFPSGELSCDFESVAAYGAIPVDWEGTDGWTTLAQFGDLIPGVKVNNIHSPTSGGCGEKTLCSYACPPGYQKSQWPETSQGVTGQSVGGVWCNEKGKLELTRPEHPKICEPGAGGVYVQNKLSGVSCVCRTDYPGNEGMAIPLVTQPGGKYPLTNPNSLTYYQWDGKYTTAQYYVNNLNVAVEQACTWTSSQFPTSAGNWAPTNIGVGQNAEGITFISLFPNKPTTTALLDFNIEITGDISGKCALKGGQYYGENGVMPDGCTVGLQSGKTAIIVFSDA